jgi:hypothetical protein
MNPDMQSSEVTVDQEVSQVRMERPHVVILGAGASRAACMGGDKNGKRLPLMNDFVQIVELKKLLSSWELGSNINFEELYSDLSARGDSERTKAIESIIEKYFNALELPDNPTIYDHLVLSLRETDLIATFNWDPFLIQAYRRNLNAGLKLPRIAFLHGNVAVGYCETDKTCGYVWNCCSKCGKHLTPSKLLYPIKNKDYASNLFIADEWKTLKHYIKNAFMITIFGYGGPKTDQEAREAMKGAWGNTADRSMEQTAFITPQSEDEICENWEPFIHTHHYEISTNFYDSWIANHPRRTGEAHLSQYWDAKFIDLNPIPKEVDFNDLWKWFEKFKAPEEAYQQSRQSTGN